MHKLIEHIENNIIEIEEGLGSLAVKGIGAVGGVVGGLSAMVTREKSNWNKAVNDHNLIREKLKKRPNDKSLKKRELTARRKKAAAYLKYEDIKNKYKNKASSFSSKKAQSTGRAIIKGGVATSKALSNVKQSSKKAISKINSATGYLPSKVHNYVTSNFHR